MPFKKIDPENKKLLVKLGDLNAMSGFYICGSSASVLHLGHRELTELDFACESETLDTEAIETELEKLGSVHVLRRSSSYLALYLDGRGMRFAANPFPLLSKPGHYSHLRIASTLDAGLDILHQISESGSKIRFLDLYFIIKSGYGLPVLIARALDKFKLQSFSAYRLLRGVAWFGDSDSEDSPPCAVPCKWDNVKEYLRKEAKRAFAEYFELGVSH